jgi:hypothetical protein
VHTELAQANLFRLRGERDAAEKKCLSILKRFPNEAEAHSLLGDLSADKEDWARAIEWYELALDLNPSSTPDRTKLDEAARRLHDAESAETVEQLGLPEPTSRLPWIIGGLIALVVICGVIALLKMPSNKPTPPLIGGKVSAPATGGSDDDQVANPSETNTSHVSVAPSADQGTAAAALPMEDRTLFQLLAKNSTQGNRLISVSQDPRDKGLVVTFTASSEDDALHSGALLAKDALDQSPETLIVTVRGVSSDHLIFVADALRTKLAEAEAAIGQSGTASDTWISDFLQREWTPAAPASTSPGSTSPSGTSTTPPEGSGSGGSGASTGATAGSGSTTSPAATGSGPATTGAGTAGAATASTGGG